MTARLLGRLIVWFVLFAGHTIAVNARAEDAYRTALGHAVAAKEKALDTGSHDDWVEVLALLRSVNAIRETAESQYEIAFAASRLGYDDLAIQAYQRSLALGLSKAAREKAQTFVAARVSELGRLVVHGPKGWRLTINGVERTSLPLAEPVLVRPGRVNVALDSDTAGAGHWEQRIDVAAQATTELVVEPAQHGTEPLVSPALPTAPSATETLPGEHRFTRAGEHFAPKETAKATRSPAPAVEEARFDWRRSSIVLSSAGATLGVLSALFLPIASNRIKAGRQGLSQNCGVQVEGPDTCQHALIGRQQAAQSFSDSIATWQAARTVSWVGLAVGISAAAAGISTYFLTKPNAFVTPHIAFDCCRAELAIDGTF